MGLVSTTLSTGYPPVIHSGTGLSKLISGGKPMFDGLVSQLVSNSSVSLAGALALPGTWTAANTASAANRLLVSKQVPDGQFQLTTIRPRIG